MLPQPWRPSLQRGAPLSNVMVILYLAVLHMESRGKWIGSWRSKAASTRTDYKYYSNTSIASSVLAIEVNDRSIL
jgi:hypothetical protein